MNTNVLTVQERWAYHDLLIHSLLFVENLEEDADQAESYILEYWGKKNDSTIEVWLLWKFFVYAYKRKL